MKHKCHQFCNVSIRHIASSIIIFFLTTNFHSKKNIFVISSTYFIFIIYVYIRIENSFSSFLFIYHIIHFSSGFMGLFLGQL